MRNRLLICIAAAALIAGGSIAHAQATNPATTDKPAAKAGASGTQETGQKPAKPQAKSAAQPRDEKGRFTKKASEPSGQNAASPSAKTTPKTAPKTTAATGAGSGQVRDEKGRFMKKTPEQGAATSSVKSTTGVGTPQSDQAKAVNGAGTKKAGADAKRKSSSWLNKAAKSATGRPQAPAAAH